MNKSELVEQVSERAAITKKQAESLVNAMFDTITKGLVEGKRVEIRGFGSFRSKSYKSYTGRNPRTGEPIEVPSKRLPTFKAGKELRERLPTGRRLSLFSPPGGIKVIPDHLDKSPTFESLFRLKIIYMMPFVA